MRAAKVVSLLAGVAAAAVSGAAHAIAWYFQSPASRLAQDIDQLHRYVMWLIIVILVGVFGFMFYACYAHRKSKGHKPEEFHENTTVEIIWTVIPAVILIVIAWPTTRVVVAQKNTSAPDLTREQIENHAPKGENYLLEVDNELVVPVGKKIRVLTTAADVVHAWWVPAFGAKQDAIPGFIRAPEYTKWVGAQKALAAKVAEDDTMTFTLVDLMSRGEKVYAQHCVAYHHATGRGVPPAFPPSARLPTTSTWSTRSATW